MAVLYLSIYHLCASFFLSAFNNYSDPHNMPIGSLFVPPALFLLDSQTWEQGPSLWTIGFVVRLVLITTFFYLQRLQVHQLKPTSVSVHSEA